MTEPKYKTVNYIDLFLRLCDSVASVISTASGNKISYAPMVQTITKTTLTPDIGTFAMFTGSFSGMVVINFPKQTAMEIYSNYMTSMGIEEKDLAQNYTSEEVSNTLGELMNQVLGHYIRTVATTINAQISQSQPKMLALPRELQINFNMNLDNPRFAKISFLTARGNVFFMELAMDNVEFKLIRDFDEKNESPEDLFKQYDI